MKGEDVKRKVAAQGYTVAEVAERIGTSRQNLSKSLSTQDVRSGLIERIASVLGVSVSYFYDPSPSPSAIASGDHSAASVHGDASVSGDSDAVLKERVKSLERLVGEKERMIEEKERTIKILMQK